MHDKDKTKEQLINEITELRKKLAEKKPAEIALNESEEKYRNLVERASDGIAITQNGIIKFLNARLAEMFGYKIPEIINTPFIEYVSQEDRPTIIEIYKNRLQGEDIPATYEFKGLHKNGETFSIEINSGLITYEGEPAVLSVFRDITERKQAEEEFRRYECIVSNTNDMLALLDKSFKYLAVNEGYLEPFGLNRDEVIGHTVADVFGEKFFKETIKPNADKCIAGEDVRYNAWFDFPAKGKRYMDVGYFPYRGSDNEIKGFVVNARDITERKLAEELLRKSGEFNRAAIDNSPMGVSARSRTGKLLYYNGAWKRIWSKSDEEIEDDLARTRNELNFTETDEYLGEWKSKVRDIYERGGYLHIPEAEHTKKDGSGSLWVSQYFYAIKDDNGEVDRVVVLTEDITERKKAEESLKESEAHQALVLRTLPMAFYIAQPFGNYGGTWVSEQIDKIAGYSPEEFINDINLWSSRIHPHDHQRVMDEFEKLNESEEISIEYRWRTKTGEYIWVNDCAVLIRDKDGNPKEIIGTWLDITARKIADESLKASEERFRTLAANIPGITYRCAYDENWTMEYISDEVEKITGYKASDFIENKIRSFASIIHPDDNIIIDDAVNDAIKNKKSYTIEYRIIDNNGDEHWVYERGRGIFNDDGSVAWLDGTILDITERKLAEEALRSSEEKFLKAFRSSPDSITISSLESGRFIEVNDVFEKLSGFKREEVIGKSAAEFGFWEGIDKRREMIEKLRKDGFVRDAEIKFHNKKRESLICLFSAEIIEIGNEKCMVAIVRDITEKILAEKALQESEARYRAIWENSPSGICLTDENGVYNYVSPAYCKIYGYTEEQMLNRSYIDLIVPEDKRAQYLETYKRRYKTGDPVPLSEGFFIKSNGDPVWVQYAGDFIKQNGKIQYMISINTDITDRKRAQEALVESEERFRRLSNAAFEGIVLTDRGVVLDVNNRIAEMLRYSPDEIIGRKVMEFVAPESIDLVMEKIRSGSEEPYEHYALRKDGTTFPVEIRAGSAPQEGRTIRVTAIWDLTESKRAEKELQEALNQVKELKNRLQAENIYLQEELKLEHNFDEIIGKSKKLKDVLRQIEQVASSNATILILGETGTGKELVARAIHGISERKDRPLVKVNCAALPANLIESELFGYEKGAFTGAVSRRLGRFELADGGTIFLDEIGDLPLELQVKLLRVIQEGELERLGGMKTIKVDVRVIAATNRDLEKAVKKGKFRNDLYHRLNVFPIVIPPLRDRKEDIPLLVNHFVIKYGRKSGKKIGKIPKRVMDALTAYDWPGNVRDLENIIERSVLISEGSQLAFGDWLSKSTATPESGKISTLMEIEKEHIIRALRTTGWRVSGEKGAARILGMNPKTLESRIRKLKIQRPQ